MSNTIENARIPQILGTATWVPWNGDIDDPTTAERGRWIVESTTGGYLGALENAHDDRDTVVHYLIDMLAPDGGHGAHQITEDTITLYGRGLSTTPTTNPDIPYTRHQMYRVLGDLITGGLAAPSLIAITQSIDYRHVDLNLDADTPSLVADWARILGVPKPTWVMTVDRLPDRSYRVYQAGFPGQEPVTLCPGWTTSISCTVDIQLDSSGLEGTGYLETVWITVRRRGAAAHRMGALGLTACGRSTHTGEIRSARFVSDHYSATFGCRICWPDGSPLGGAS